MTHPSRPVADRDTTAPASRELAREGPWIAAIVVTSLALGATVAFATQADGSVVRDIDREAIALAASQPRLAEWRLPSALQPPADSAAKP